MKRMKAGDVWGILQSWSLLQAWETWITPRYGQGDWTFAWDEKKAKHYYELAAVGGNAMSRYNLAKSEEEAGNTDRELKYYSLLWGWGTIYLWNRSVKCICWGRQRKMIIWKVYEYIKHTWKRLRVLRGTKPLHLMISANTTDGGGGMGICFGNFSHSLETIGSREGSAMSRCLGV